MDADLVRRLVAAQFPCWAGLPVTPVVPGGHDHRTFRLGFGTSGVGDPACDLVIAWTLLRGRARAAFREALGADDATWARGRGWALWKALITFDVPASRATLAEVLADHANGKGAG